MAKSNTVFDVAALASAPRDGPRSILRLLQVFTHLSAAPEGCTLAQLCAALALPKTTLFTMLKVLESADYVTLERGVYGLGKAAVALGQSMARAPGAAFPECAVGILQRLAQRSGETVFLAVLTPDRLNCKYVSVIESDNWLRYTVKLGSQKPSYATGTGRAMLAYLPPAEVKALLESTRFERLTPGTISSRRALTAALAEVRRRGVSTVDSGTVAGVVSVAAPIFGADGQVVAALSIGGPSARIELHLRSLEPAARDGAQEVSRLLGFSGTWPPVR